jgi:glycosyltransferase involved in cell wall biosynthesis
MTKPSASYILWLPSWYPNKLAPFDGDFIQRHAKAAALYDDILVIYGVPGEAAKLSASVDESVTRNGRLTEHIIYFRRSPGLLERIRTFVKWNKLLKRTIRQYVKEIGRPGIVHVHVPLKAGLIARWIKRRYGVSYIVSEHSAHYKMGSHDDFFDRNFIYRKEVMRVFRGATAVTNVSAAMGNIIKTLFNLGHIYIVNNTVDTSLFNYESSGNKKFRFIHVSTLTESQKNVTGILNAVKKLSKTRRDFKLIIVGPASKELRELVTTSGIDDLVGLTGEISYADVSKQMKMASALVLFSRYENLPCVIIEALCCGLPIVATNVGGIKELVNLKNGKLVQSENEEELIRAMVCMIDEYNNFDKEQISLDARERFNYSTIGKQFHQLYQQVLPGTHKS